MVKHVDIVTASRAVDDEFEKLTRGFMKSLIESEDNIIFHIYIIESGNRDYEGATTVHLKGEFNYNQYMNIGRREGNSPYVCLCNNDIVFEKGWASRIIEAMEDNPEILSASPFCPEKQDMAVNGWCIFQQRKIYDIIGDLDERYRFWYCDDAYWQQMKDNNITHATVLDSIVHHHGDLLGKTAQTMDELTQKELMKRG